MKQTNEPVNFVCGKERVLEAIKSENEIEKIIISQGIPYHHFGEISLECRRRKIVKTQLPKETLDELYPNNGGIVAIIGEVEYTTLETVIAASKPDSTFVILDQIEDPQNLGAILRSCECSGVDAVIIPDRRACAVTKTAVRVSSGAANYLKIAKISNLSQSIQQLKDAGFWIYGTDVKGDKNHFEEIFEGKVALVIGNEGKGMRKLVTQSCDVILQIPIKGVVKSLNASVATGIILYEILRQRLVK
ncbi:23S rRNA (guanosine(2251)-2'-O)-methyltransferase RlmB [bacterium]|nr:23S rRNA (guanosine(2251)-2'-O)-methyltransferase RlmB [bacterium]